MTLCRYGTLVVDAGFLGVALYYQAHLEPTVCPMFQYEPRPHVVLPFAYVGDGNQVV